MSFRCGICNDPQPTGSRPIKVVLETRFKRYRKRPQENDPGGVGKEIVWEADACSDCHAIHKRSN